MINLPEWITAGTAVTAVLGGLFGVYSTTQSDMSVERERLNTLVETVSRIGLHQEQLSLSAMAVRERLVKSEVGGEYLRIGQTNITKNVSEIGGEVRQMNRVLIKIYAHHEAED